MALSIEAVVRTAVDQAIAHGKELRKRGIFLYLLLGYAAYGSVMTWETFTKRLASLQAKVAQ